MAYFKNIWGSLQMSALPVGMNHLNALINKGNRLERNIIYNNNRAYSRVYVHVSKRMAHQIIEQQANSLIPRYLKSKEDKKRQKVLLHRDSKLEKLIADGKVVEDGLGSITVNGRQIFAKNKYGDVFNDALILYYEMDREMEFTDYTSGQEKNYKSNTLCFIDLVASVTANSSKNIVLTQVQGRDFTRKELISGGDINFSINGKIVGNDRGIYPTNEVKKLIQLSQYGGVINVNHYLFKQFNVTKVIIQDFKLHESDSKNVQPYSISCVAVEPDEDVIITKDTIGALNDAIAESPKDAWYKAILYDAVDRVANSAGTLAGGSFDGLVNKI